MSTNIVWMASEARKNASHMAHYLEFLKNKYHLTFSNYADLHQWSTLNTQAFWKSISEFTELKWITSPREIFHPPPQGKMLGSKWFTGGTLNFAQNLLPAADKKIVLQSYCEGTPTKDLRTLTGKELHDAVWRCAGYFRSLGLKKGERVAAVTANVPEAIIAMLATASIGAVWSSCSPDFGAAGIIDRFAQIAPKILLYTARYAYAGKMHDCKGTLQTCLPQLPSVERAIDIDHLGGKSLWQEVMAFTPAEPLTFEAMGYDDPLFIMFSSGTTGAPKCIVHGTIGTLIQHKKELMLHSDLHAESNMLFFTTCGWMMWNWMVSALSVGTKLTLFEGSLTYPNIDILWEIVEKAKVNVLGTSPKFLSLCGKENISPKRAHDFEHLHTILCTGAPLLSEHYQWLYEHIKADIHIASISGGTDIISCFMLGNPMLPVYPGEIQCLGLGMAVAAWDDEGAAQIGEKGELVCTQPFPSMPLGFWGKDGQEKYLNTYFSHYPNQQVWWHGDFIEITPRGSVIVYGRSDTTLNPGGVRIGSAEIYRQVEDMIEVRDSLVIGHDFQGDVRILLFVKLADEKKIQDNLKDKIKTRIRSSLTPRHVPARIFQVSDIPYTKSGKKVESAVTSIFNRQAVKNTSALQNPDSLAEYVAIARKENKA